MYRSIVFDRGTFIYQFFTIIIVSEKIIGLLLCKFFLQYYNFNSVEDFWSLEVLLRRVRSQNFFFCFALNSVAGAITVRAA